MKKHPIREILGDALLMASGAAFFYQFVTIAFLGWYGREPVKWILAIEILMGVAIFALGLERFLKDVRSRRK